MSDAESRPSAAPPENVLPASAGTAALLRVDEVTAVGVTGVRSCPSGFSMELWLYRAGRTGRWASPAPPEPVLLRLRYADGRAGTTTVPPIPRPAPAITASSEPLLVLPQHSYSGPGPARQEVWVSPLPPEGPVEVLLLTLAGAPLVSGMLSGEEIRIAAHRSVEVWPEAQPAAPVFDADLAPPLPPAGRAPDDERESADAIRSAFRRAFGGPSEDDRFDAVQDGAVLGPAAAEAGRRWPAVAATMQVGIGGVAFLDEVRAAVQYQLTWAGAAEFGPQLGYAVRERGEWKVARGTYCRLLDWAGVAYPPPPPAA